MAHNSGVWKRKNQMVMKCWKKKTRMKYKDSKEKRKKRRETAEGRKGNHHRLYISAFYSSSSFLRTKSRKEGTKGGRKKENKGRKGNEGIKGETRRVSHRSTALLPSPHAPSSRDAAVEGKSKEGGVTIRIPSSLYSHCCDAPSHAAAASPATMTSMPFRLCLRGLWCSKTTNFFLKTDFRTTSRDVLDEEVSIKRPLDAARQ